ncbi:MAG: sigma-70 family RNA polymerase sigma factor [Planctomycetota bacterium]
MSEKSTTGGVANPGSTDVGLIEGIRAHDDRAWAKFVEEYVPLIYVWCRKCDLPSEDARDVSQQVLQSVNRSIESFSKRGGNGSFRGWLFTITRNLVRNHLSRTLRGPRAQGGTSIQIRLLEEPEQIDEGSLTGATSNSQGSQVQTILDSVRKEFDARTWQCFWLVVMEEQSAVEVAERFGMNAAAVRQAKYRVTKRLRRDLGDQV